MENLSDASFVQDERIIRTFYGSYLDLSRIIQISPVTYEHGLWRTPILRFSIELELVEKPFVYQRMLVGEEMHQRRVAIVLASGETVYSEKDINDFGMNDLPPGAAILGMRNLQAQVDDLAQQWRKFRATKNKA